MVDASALLAWVLNERGATTVGKLLRVAVVPAANLVEVLYGAPERGHRMAPGELHEHVLAMGVTVEPFTDGDVERAAALIQQSRAGDHPSGGSLSLGDGLCLAVAERLRLPVTGGDQLWAAVQLNVAYLPFRR